MVLGVLTLVCVGALLVQDAFPRLQRAMRQSVLEAVALAAIAVAYLVYQALHRPRLAEWIKAVLLSAAFLFWAANQVCPDQAEATLFNDLAIGLFVLDVVLVMTGWPAAMVDRGFPESGE